MPHKDPEARKAWQKQYNEKRLLENHNYRIEIQRKYRERNKERLRESQKLHYQKNRSKILAWYKDYRKQHPEKMKEKYKKHYAKKKDEINAKHRAYYHANYEKSKEQKRKSRLKHRDQTNLRIKIRRKNEKHEVMSIYSKGEPMCACCNESIFEFLEIDHISGRKQMVNDEKLRMLGYDSKLQGKELYLWLKKNNCPEGFQVLCSNCNKAKWQFGKCPHQNS